MSRELNAGPERREMKNIKMGDMYRDPILALLLSGKAFLPLGGLWADIYRGRKEGGVDKHAASAGGEKVNAVGSEKFRL